MVRAYVHMEVPRMAERELIDTGRDKRYVRRDEAGRFDESDDVGRSSSQHGQRDAKHEAPRGQGDPWRQASLGREELA
jgi:hypothetical protein